MVKRIFYIVGNLEFGNSIFSKIVLANKEAKRRISFYNGTKSI